ncbi:hypothetical protein [Streptomyces axinellae]|uniref:hypothetical protein n=1 Tax=Streptomyces axinellae TaxID=552788 RepID=UPI0031E1D406
MTDPEHYALVRMNSSSPYGPIAPEAPAGREAEHRPTRARSAAGPDDGDAAAPLPGGSRARR